MKEIRNKKLREYFGKDGPVLAKALNQLLISEYSLSQVPKGPRSSYYHNILYFPYCGRELGYEVYKQAGDDILFISFFTKFDKLLLRRWLDGEEVYIEFLIKAAGEIQYSDLYIGEAG